MKNEKEKAIEWLEKESPKRFNQMIQKGMYEVPVMMPTTLKINQSTQGESIEQKIERIVANKEPIKDGAPLIYTERKTGIKPSYNVRTDRFEIAIDAADKIAKSYKARRDERHKPKDGEPESIQGKEGTTTEPKN